MSQRHRAGRPRRRAAAGPPSLLRLRPALGTALRRASAAALCLLLGVAGLADAARAHSRSVSWSSWERQGDEIRVLLRVPQLELTRLPFGTVSPPALPPGLARYATETLVLEADGTPCPVVRPPRALVAPAERAVLEWRVRCPEAARLEIESRFLQDVAPSHLHFARLRGGEGPALERVLTAASPRMAIAAPAGAASSAGGDVATYVRVGVEHIASGYDHLLFLLALLMLASRVSEVVTIVTGFTVAHSLTLALAALSQLRPEAAAIQSLVGLSIALVAAENGWILAGRPRALPRLWALGLLGMAALAAAGIGAVPPLTLLGLALFTACYFDLERRVARPMRLRFAIAFCFGLVHGFGFAGVLTEGALSHERLLAALLGFNVGVELGQLAIVVAAWPVLRWVADPRRGGIQRGLVEAGTGAVCGLGVYWMIVRAYGA